MTIAVTRESVADLHTKSVDSLNIALDDSHLDTLSLRNTFCQRFRLLILHCGHRIWKICPSYVKVQWLIDHFRQPLQGADIESDVGVLREFKDIKTYYSPGFNSGEILIKQNVGLGYTQDNKKYGNFLLLVKLILTIPFPCSCCRALVLSNLSHSGWLAISSGANFSWRLSAIFHS